MAASQARKQQGVDTRDPIEVLRNEKWLDTDDIRRAMSTVGRPWTREKARRWLIRSGCGFQMDPRPDNCERGQHGGKWFTTISLLIERFPNVVAAIQQERLERDEYGDDD